MYTYVYFLVVKLSLFLAPQKENNLLYNLFPLKTLSMISNHLSLPLYPLSRLRFVGGSIKYINIGTTPTVSSREKRSSVSRCLRRVFLFKQTGGRRIRRILRRTRVRVHA